MNSKFVGQRAKRFRSAMDRYPMARRAELEVALAAAKRYLPESRGSLIVDLGAGEGYLTRALLAEFGSSARVMAVESSSDMASSLAKRVPTATVSNTELFELSLADSSVDLVISLAVLHHVTAKKRTLRELARVLHPGAKAILIDIPDGAIQQKFFESFVRTCCSTGHDFDFMDFEWIRLLASQCGLQHLDSKLHSTPWFFATASGAVSFVMTLLSLDTSARDCSRALKKLLPVEKSRGGVQVPWELTVHVLQKPV